MVPSADLFVEEGSARLPTGALEAEFVVVSVRLGACAGVTMVLVIARRIAIAEVSNRQGAMAPFMRSKALRIDVDIFVTRLI
jgi:hypothetical protein